MATPDAPLDPLLGRIRIAEAAPDQLALVAAVLDDASHRLSRWVSSSGRCRFRRTRFCSRSGAIVYLAWDGDVAAGTFTLQRRDAAFWPEAAEAVGGLESWGSDGTRPVYLHRFATRTGYRGLGLRMLGEAEAIARGLGANLMRLDCVSSDARIRRYYEDAGFEFRGDIQPAHLTFPAARYEKRLD